MIVTSLCLCVSADSYSLALHDALPIWSGDAFPGLSVAMDGHSQAHMDVLAACPGKASPLLSVNSKEGSQSLPDKPDRKRTRLISSHVRISYAVLCLRKKR